MYFREYTITEQSDNVYKMKKLKRPYKGSNRSYGGTVKKPCIEDSRLYLSKGEKGGFFGSVLAFLIPFLIEPVAKLFGGKKLKRRRRRRKIK